MQHFLLWPKSTGSCFLDATCKLLHRSNGLWRDEIKWCTTFCNNADTKYQLKWAYRLIQLNSGKVWIWSSWICKILCGSYGPDYSATCWWTHSILGLWATGTSLYHPHEYNFGSLLRCGSQCQKCTWSVIAPTSVHVVLVTLVKFSFHQRGGTTSSTQKHLATQHAIHWQDCSVMINYYSAMKVSQAAAELTRCHLLLMPKVTLNSPGRPGTVNVVNMSASSLCKLLLYE